MTDERSARAQITRCGDMVWRLALARTCHWLYKGRQYPQKGAE